MRRALSAVPDLVPDRGVDLSTELKAARALATTAIESKDTDSASKMLNAVTRVAEFQRKGEEAVTIAELKALVIAMAGVVNAHVHDRAAQAKIHQGWTALMAGALK